MVVRGHWSLSGWFWRESGPLCHLPWDSVLPIPKGISPIKFPLGGGDFAGSVVLEEEKADLRNRRIGPIGGRFALAEGCLPCSQSRFHFGRKICLIRKQGWVALNWEVSNWAGLKRRYWRQIGRKPEASDYLKSQFYAFSSIEFCFSCWV